MRKSVIALAAGLIAVLLVPVTGRATADCAVVWDPAGDVSGPLGTPRPGMLSGANIDLTGVSMMATPGFLRVTMSVRDLSSAPTTGTDGAFYAVFWSLGVDRYFAQASRVGQQTGWTFQAGHAAGVDDRLPQQGLPVDRGFALISRSIIRIDVPAPLAGGPETEELLQQVRARSEESAARTESVDPAAPIDHVAALSDAAGGLEGGRYLFGGVCLGLLSGSGERCVVATDPSSDAIGGPVPDVTRGTEAEPRTRSIAYGPVDPATEILSLQMGANASTLIVELAVASLRHPVPDGAEAERWEVAWTIGLRSFIAFAERRARAHSFGYAAGGDQVPTSGFINSTSGTIRILVPRHEAGAEGIARMVGVEARSDILTAGSQRDGRDTAGGSWATQFVAGVSCAEQEKAACPVVLDVTGDAEVVNDVTEEQPASDLAAGGAAGPAGEIVLSVRVADIGAPPPEGFNRQGWTVSWVWGAMRYYAQAERTARDTVFRYGIVGQASQTSGPSGPRFIGSARADGVFDVRAGVVSISVPRDGIGLPGDGAQLTQMGVQSWVMGSGTGAAQELKVDETPLAPYRVGLACGA